MDIKTKKIKKRIVIALGGNAILDTESSGTYEDQIQRIRQTIQGLGDILQNPHNEIIITHGNGPQIGSLLIQNVHSTDVVPAMPMLLCSAMTEGSMGFLLTGEIRNALNTSLVKKSVVSIITTVEVDSKDASFKNLTKPIGPFYTKEESEALTKKLACTYKEDSGRGYRRVVPSPTPKRILEIDTICDILSTKSILVACGGGGIPVVKNVDGSLLGIDAVIDKDSTSALLADAIDADELIMITSIDHACLNFGTSHEAPLNNMSITEARHYIQEGQFAEGSMQPKIQASIDFISGGAGKRSVLITSIDALGKALQKKNGTYIS